MRPGHDWAYPYYRDLGFSLQFGYTIEEIMLEALHRRGGPSSDGFAMPFHYGHRKWRIVSQSSPTGTQYLQALGTAMGAVKDGTNVSRRLKATPSRTARTKWCTFQAARAPPAKGNSTRP